jgi:hypothetical protein
MNNFSEFHHWVFEKPYGFMCDLVWVYEKTSFTGGARLFAKQSLVCAQVAKQKTLLICNSFDELFWSKNIPKISPSKLKKGLQLDTVYT